MDKRVRKCFSKNVITLKFYFIFVIYIFRLLEMILELDFLCSWWVMKSFFQLIRMRQNRIFIFRNFGKILVTASISRLKLLQKKACAMHVSRLNSIFSIYFRLTYMKKHEKEQNNLFV